jgi:hypothetical protein
MRLSDGSEHRCGRTYARPLGKIGSLLGNLAEMSKLETFTAQGAFTPVLAKHSKSFSLVGAIAVGVDRMQRNFAPMRKQVEAWQQSELTDLTAKVVIYQAFIEGRREAPKHLARSVAPFTSS